MILRLALASALAATVAGHAAMISPAPRSAHAQTFDAANKCDCQETGHCYSNITGDARYCGLGCLGEACLYYQIGCFAGCGTCSYTGKDLYPSAEDLQLAGDCKPIAPTLPEEMRSYNKDTLSTMGDWTKVNPWRAPGTAGRGNSKFQPCGVNSGWITDHPSRGSAGPGAGGQPVGANGTDLPPVGPPTVWHAGGVADVEFSIYANHGGGYAYRLCPTPEAGDVPTEGCFEGGYLSFATDTTTIKYHDGSRAPFNISAKTTDVGTYPQGSQWRLNPIPMCNCDQGAYCRGAADAAVDTAAEEKKAADFLRAIKSGGKACHAVSKAQCGSEIGVNTCLKCATGGSYDCEQCCPGFVSVSQGGYTWCQPNKCQALMEKDCASQRSKGTLQCDSCLKTNWDALTAAGCTVSDAKWCSGKAPPSPSPSPPSKPTQFTPYPKTYLPDGVTSSSCPTGLMFNASWPEGAGSGPTASGYGDATYSMTDKVGVPNKPGKYSLSWRWDCEQTPQVWNSCADIVIV